MAIFKVFFRNIQGIWEILIVLLGSRSHNNFDINIHTKM